MTRVSKWLRREDLENVWLVIFGLLVLNDFVPWSAVRGFVIVLTLGLIVWAVVQRRRKWKLIRAYDNGRDRNLDELIQGLTNARAYLDGARAYRDVLRKQQEAQ
jgi:hypothetical protein